ncbi:prepilin-type N-terminal cleavage/methylation domain-containing protein [Singulisphaera sp. GP187]|uniref:prepilin-type N-terminal cleavage/methylation domain-containing protein n=1 Tax=Singulisphaera sp. GP187 TaxID=1882752 RepID=UPI00092B52F7|nr:prepilin-type N-terminal cleavage/methylation domain-containing protein [Singulisphaera sp. GP187]SIO11731.1 prepilin-type N-terminal cleavage/methylation domain-containing protein [Singulisphaera sp. GP187]
MRIQERQHPRSGFTLVEILVVLAIILLASLVAIPTLVTTLNGRQITDAARIFTGSLVGIRDSAARYNSPRGMRLLPDPTLTIPAPGQPGAGSLQLCYNRMIPIEPAGDFSQGMVSIGPQLQNAISQTGFPPAYAFPDQANIAGGTYLFPNSPTPPYVLMIEESPFAGGFVTPLGQPNSPTNWYWTIRVGDKIKIGGSGRAYTIVGPCTINPWASAASGFQGNPELFVNVGPPGTTTPLERTYYTPTVGPPAGFAIATKARPEFLFLVNGEDDDKDGYVDEGFDGQNNNKISPPNKPVGTIDGRLPTDNLFTDEPFEWEPEAWSGSLAANILIDAPAIASTNSPSVDWVTSKFQQGTHDVPYIIQRRPVPSSGAREIVLPAGMVIDATTWNTTQERSRIPIEPGSLYCDVMVDTSGHYIPTTQYSAPTSADPLPFLHFWLTDRNDVYPRGSIWGRTGSTPNQNPSDPTTGVYTYYELPMTTDALAADTTNAGFDVAGPGNYPPSGTPTAPVLKYDRRLVTMFTTNGLVVTNTIESVPRLFITGATQQPLVFGEGFKTSDVGYPFLKAQQGLREAR